MTLRMSGDSADARSTDDVLFGEGKAPLTARQARSLFVSHALSTWNARTYEFAVILFTAAAFPDTLLMSSLRGLVVTLAALVGSSAIGSAIDRASSRLRSLTLTILCNRLSICAASVAWFWLVRVPEVNGYSTSRLAVFAFAVSFGILEKLSSIGNMLASERDWVPALADKNGVYTLTVLNSVMRRIDLMCKLVAPLAISMLITLTSIQTAVVFVAGMSAVSCGIEIITAKWVWDGSSQLRQPKIILFQVPDRKMRSLSQKIAAGMMHQSAQLREYFDTDIWVPSIALALLHLSTLSYAASLTTYLLNSGYSLLLITIARAFGSIVEVSSTFIAPATVKRLAKIRTQGYSTTSTSMNADEENIPRQQEHSTGLARSGLWGITLQWACLVPVILALWEIDPERSIKSESPSLSGIVPRNLPTLACLNAASVTLFFFLSFSRLGLWIFDLTTQEITQTGTEASKRSSFAGTEMSFVSLFELSQWVFTAAFSKPEQFRWLAVGSFGAVSVSALAYATWVRQQRGHLFHWYMVKGDCLHNRGSLYSTVRC
ncbi:hypothetical protein FH972_023496 [Carpinus fangiana]|uniref:Solute carrier family 40 member n=1 Tax=Carpinus fangiana TaxID=176857 RepID=A0A5N6KVV3_9ROSI|nr:hypothetical protein FH972_023496 [Carpinus fangiana]